MGHLCNSKVELETQSGRAKRVKRTPTGRTKADGTDTLDAVDAAQKTIRELHNGRDPNRPTGPAQELIYIIVSIAR